MANFPLIPGPQPTGQAQAPNYADTYPLVGLSGLAQGFTHGLELGHDWGAKADQLTLENKKADEAEGYRRDNLLRLENQAEATNVLKQQLADIAQQRADDAARSAAPTGEVVKSPDGTMYWEGKGWKPMPTAGGAAKAKSDSALEMLDAVSTKWDALGGGKTTAGATLEGSKLKMQSMFPSTDAGQYDAAAQALAGKLDHDLLGRVNDLTIANAKKAIPGFFDTPESKANKIEYIRGIYQQASKAPATGASPAAKSATPPAGFSPHVNKKTGQTAYLNAKGELWQP